MIIDNIRERFGNLSIPREIVMTDEFIANLDIKESNVIFSIDKVLGRDRRAALKTGGQVCAILVKSWEKYPTFF